MPPGCAQLGAGDHQLVLVGGLLVMADDVVAGRMLEQIERWPRVQRLAEHDDLGAVAGAQQQAGPAGLASRRLIGKHDEASIGVRPGRAAVG